MNYPTDFGTFGGKKLNDNEIDELLQEALTGSFDNLATGDTMIEIDEDNNVTVWEQRAYLRN